MVFLAQQLGESNNKVLHRVDTLGLQPVTSLTKERLPILRQAVQGILLGLVASREGVKKNAPDPEDILDRPLPNNTLGPSPGLGRQPSGEFKRRVQ